MKEKIYAKLSPKFSNYQQIINSIDNESLLNLLKKHNINLAKELGKIASPLNRSGDMFALLMPSPAIPSDEQIEDAVTKQRRKGGTLCYYPEYIFADDNGMGFLVRYRQNKDFDFYALIVRDYKSTSYLKLFSNQHNMPKIALKEYVDSLNFTDLSKLNFYKNHALTWHALCLCTDNVNHKGDIYVQEISQSTMDNEFKKQEILSKLFDSQIEHDYNLTALYSNGGEILHCEDKQGNPFDAFILNVEYYNLDKEKVNEEHYVFAYGQEMVPFTVDGKIVKDEAGRIYYDINHNPDARGKNTPVSKEEAETIFYRQLAPLYAMQYPILESNPNSISVS